MPKKIEGIGFIVFMMILCGCATIKDIHYLANHTKRVCIEQCDLFHRSKECEKPEDQRECGDFCFHIRESCELLKKCEKECLR